MVDKPINFTVVPMVVGEKVAKIDDIDVNTVTDGQFLRRDGSDVAGSSMVEENDQIVMTKSLRVPQSSLFVGPNITISDFAGRMGVKDNVDNIFNTAVVQSYDEATGTSIPKYLQAGPAEVVLNQPLTDANTGSVNQVEFLIDTTGLFTNEVFLLSNQLHFNEVPAGNKLNNRVYEGTSVGSGTLIFEQDFDIPAIGAVDFVPNSPGFFKPNTNYVLQLTAPAGETFEIAGTMVSGSLSPFFRGVGYVITELNIATEQYVNNLLAYDSPAIISLSITELPDLTPDAGFDFAGVRTVNYSVSNTSNVDGDLTVSWDGVNLLTNVSAFATSVSVTIPSTIAAVGESHSLVLSGLNTNGDTFSRTLTYRTPQPHELIYFGTQTSSDATTFDFANESSEDFVAVSQSFTIPTFTGTEYLVYAQRSTENDVTEIRIGGLNQLDAFTKVPNAFTVNSQNFDAWITINLLLGSVVSGDRVEIFR